MLLCAFTFAKSLYGSMRRKSARAAHLQYDAAAGSLCWSSVAVRSKKNTKGKTPLQLPYGIACGRGR